MATISVRSSGGNYRVVCRAGAVAGIASHLEKLADITGVFILSSPTVWKNCGRKVLASFRGKRKPAVILFNDAESAKRLATVEDISRRLTREEADRRAVLVAVGGGVVGDVAGFVAATYLRGVRVVHVPTTLVAQVDSAIGGKTGVNLPEGKNRIGAFYPPILVVADPDLLATLPHRQYRSGLYEVIKYGVIADAKLFSYLAREMPGLLHRDRKALEYVIPRCIGIKADVVGKDEREGGLRQILNFGHTYGHALEAATGYRKFLHGEAVAWGMIAATALALAGDRISRPEGFAIFRLVGAVGALPTPPKIPRAKLHRFLSSDKKSRKGHARWVLPRRLGQVDRDTTIDPTLVEKVVPVLPRVLKEANEGILGKVKRRR